MNHYMCPACKRYTFALTRDYTEGESLKRREFMVYPKAYNRIPLPPEVPTEFQEDYQEACLVLPDSPKASAALSRRCLQHLLRDKAGIKKKDLYQEIEEVKNHLPSDLGEALDAVRVIGNFSAHPMKSTNTGEIIPVEPGEAEWLLDVLEQLFDYYFVRPAKLAAARAKINEKLKEAGKPELT
jgi:hypothetical protein